MIYLYDEQGKIVAEYTDWKLRDVEIDLHNGALRGKMLQCDDIRFYKFVDDEYAEKTVDEKYAEKLITKKQRDDANAEIAKQAENVLIQKELIIMAKERLGI